MTSTALSVNSNVPANSVKSDVVSVKSEITDADFTELRDTKDFIVGAVENALNQISQIRDELKFQVLNNLDIIGKQGAENRKELLSNHENMVKVPLRNHVHRLNMLHKELTNTLTRIKSTTSTEK